jgi:nucleoside-diphosphate-sugar epimerase
LKLKILFIGGTGVISSACTDLFLDQGHELYLLSRGMSIRRVSNAAKVIQADIRDLPHVEQLIAEHYFDVVVDWIAYTLQDVQRSYQLFSKKTAQYIFISSASAYAKPPVIPITETHKMENPYWSYSDNKIKCEQFLLDKFYTEKFPVTIIRPSHTYDKTKIPLHGGFTALNRLINGKKVIIHGDGTSLWTLTHHKDFAFGFSGVIGRKEAIGEVFHITGDEALTWDQVCTILADAAGVEANIIHIPSDYIIRFDKNWGDGLLGDKAYSMVFDNSKIKMLNPQFKANISYSEGCREIVEWYMADGLRQIVDEKLDQKMESMILNYETALSNI